MGNSSAIAAEAEPNLVLPRYNPFQKKKHPARVFFLLEQVMGIEPTSKAWEALILPMNYTCTLLFSLPIISYFLANCKLYLT